MGVVVRRCRHNLKVLEATAGTGTGTAGITRARRRLRSRLRDYGLELPRGVLHPVLLLRVQQSEAIAGRRAGVSAGA